MPSPPLTQDSEPILALRDASKMVVEGVNHTYPAFRNLTLDVYAGERLGVFGVNGAEAKALVACLSGVEPLDAGSLEQRGSVSWPVGINDAFSGKLSGYVNARFAAEVYSPPGQIEADLQRIRELADISEQLFYQPFGEWPGAKKDALKLAVSLAFDFDVITVARLGGWDHRAVHPRAVRIRECFERRIDGRTLIVCANGQNGFALDYCDEGLAVVGGELLYRGDPEVCLELVKEEAKRLKYERRQRVNRRIGALIGRTEDDLDDLDGVEAEPDPDQEVERDADRDVMVLGAVQSRLDRAR
jgi:ABC-type polysaccharide/polyol phosphate transport system ATPase subunit